MRIAVFCPNPIGDAVMATPAFRALRRGFPAATIAGVVRPHVGAALEGTRWFDFSVRFDPRSREPEERALAILRRLRRERFELAVLFPNSFRVATLACLAGIPRRIGYVHHGRSILLTDRLYFPRDAARRRLIQPAADSYLQLVRRLGCPVESAAIELATTSDDEAAADRAYSALGLSQEERVVCLNTGGAYGPAKDWPSSHFASLARELAEKAGVSVLVVCGPIERANAREIVRLAGHSRVVGLAEQTLGIGLTKACVRRAALMITTDSGPRHFAAAFNTPVITLYGPTHIAWTRTDHPHAWDLFHPVTCGPCQRPACPQGHHRCMRDLSPQSVSRLALHVLELQASRAQSTRDREHTSSSVQKISYRLN